MSAAERVPLLEADPLDEFVERVARRVVELLDERDSAAATAGASRMVDAAALARALSVSRATVYEHALELGAVQLGGGDRPRLRFDVDEARERWTRRVQGESSEPTEAPAVPAVRPARRRAAARMRDHLLPIGPMDESTDGL